VEDVARFVGAEERLQRRYRATWNGAVLAESEETVVVEGNQYFPLNDVLIEHLRVSASHTICGWKGEANVVVAASLLRLRPKRIGTDQPVEAVGTCSCSAIRTTNRRSGWTALAEPNSQGGSVGVASNPSEPAIKTPFSGRKAPELVAAGAGIHETIQATLSYTWQNCALNREPPR